MVLQDSMKWQTEIWKLLFLIRFFWIRFFFRVCCFYLPVQQVWLDVDAACRGALPAVSDGFFSWRSPFFVRHHLLLCFKAPSRRNKAQSRKLWRFFVLQTFWFQTYLHIRRTAPPSWREWHQHLNCRNLEGKVTEWYGKKTLRKISKTWKLLQKNGNFWKHLANLLFPRLLKSGFFLAFARPVLVDKKDQAPASFRKTRKTLIIETWNLQAKETTTDWRDFYKQRAQGLSEP